MPSAWGSTVPVGLATSISLVELGEVLFDVFFKSVYMRAHFLRRVVILLAVNGFEFTSIDGHNSLREHIHLSAKINEGAAGVFDTDERPAIVDTRERFGDWEVDTVLGKHGTGA